MVVYRLVETDPPTHGDFRSQRDLRPDREFKNVSECGARGVSVYVDLQGVRQTARQRNMRGRLVCEVVLDNGSGRIIQSGRNPSHHTWWPLANFDILANCSVVTT